jgi:hypothetical protein
MHHHEPSGHRGTKRSHCNGRCRTTRSGSSCAVPTKKTRRLRARAGLAAQIRRPDTCDLPLLPVEIDLWGSFRPPATCDSLSAGIPHKEVQVTMTGPPPTSRGDGEWSANQVKRVLDRPDRPRDRARPRPGRRAHPPTIRPDRREGS